jgi:hypothetical protein
MLRCVVPLESAILPGYTPIGIRSDHVDMTKFKHKDDPGFIAVAGELRRWVKELSVPSNTGLPSTAPLQQQQVEPQQGPWCT